MQCVVVNRVVNYYNSCGLSILVSLVLVWTVWYWDRLGHSFSITPLLSMSSFVFKIKYLKYVDNNRSDWARQINVTYICLFGNWRIYLQFIRKYTINCDIYISLLRHYKWFRLIDITLFHVMIFLISTILYEPYGIQNRTCL